MKHTVDGDADEIADFLDLGPGQLERAKIPEYEVTVCATRLELIPVLDELICKRLRVFNHLLCVGLPVRLHRLQQRGRDAGNGVIMGATLASREHSVVHAFLEVFISFAILAEKDETSTRAAERLVSMRAFA